MKFVSVPSTKNHQWSTMAASGEYMYLMGGQPVHFIERFLHHGTGIRAYANERCGGVHCDVCASCAVPSVTR